MTCGTIRWEHRRTRSLDPGRNARKNSGKGEAHPPDRGGSAPNLGGAWRPTPIQENRIMKNQRNALFVRLGLGLGLVVGYIAPSVAQTTGGTQSLSSGSGEGTGTSTGAGAGINSTGGGTGDMTGPG